MAEMASRAVVIGSARYAADSAIDSHEEINQSARMYGRILATDDLWRSNHRVLQPAEVDTADGVMRALKDEADRTSVDDTFLVIYIGHGAYWSDIPDAQVHFSVGSSYRSQPWTWLSSWYIYRVMRQCRAKLKVLIADCCFSNMLPHLGSELSLPGVLGQSHQGTCVFTALKDADLANVEGCGKLDDELSTCTPFSGHLLDVLRNGTRDYHRELTVGMLRDAVKKNMRGCDSRHDEPRMVLNDAPESSPLFTNRKDPAQRDPRPSVPVNAEQWVATLQGHSEPDVDLLLGDPRQTGEVVVRLWETMDERSRQIALRINTAANSVFDTPDAFAKYWNKAERAFH
jgi:hypothetical protein